MAQRKLSDMRDSELQMLAGGIPGSSAAMLIDQNRQALPFTKQGGDTRTFQQYDRNNKTAQRQIGSTAAGVLIPNNPYREQAAQQLLENVNTAMTDPMMGTFAGTGAKLADLVKLQKAQKMIAGLERGTPEFMAADRAAWKETGWTHAFPDGKPRFEISDNLSVPLRSSDELHKYAKRGMPFVKDDLVSSFKQPEVYQNYPAMNFTQVQHNLGGVDGGGYYAANTIGLNASDLAHATGDARSTFLHEGQHKIQETEGHAMGGSPDALETQYNNARARLNFLQNDPDYLAAQKRIDAAWNDVFSDKIPEHKGMELEKQILTEHPAYAESRNIMKELNQTYNSQVGNSWQPEDSRTIGMNAYKRLAGEAESRLTQKRMDLTPEQRLNQYPVDQFDVPPDQQIVRFKDSKNQLNQGLQ